MTGTNCAMDRYVEEARADALFSQLWSSEDDPLFRPFASAVLAFARVADLPSGVRADLYRDIATGERARLLDRVSGFVGWRTRIRLLSKATWQRFNEEDWRALFLAGEDPATRRALGHLKEISPVLVHQVLLVPEAIRIPAVLAVLNSLSVSTVHWQQLATALAETPSRLRPSLLNKAKRVTSIGSFWDYFFECVTRPWRPFDLPEPFLLSSMLEPLRTVKELAAEGLRMENCLASRTCGVRAGRQAYFRWKGAEPATVEFLHGHGWHLGRILGPGNQPVPLAELEKIQACAALLLSDQPGNTSAQDDPSTVAIKALCARTRERYYSTGEPGRLAAALEEIRGKTGGLGPETNAWCVFAADLGYLQFMADISGDEYLCEIQSHRYYEPVELRLTDAAVTLITECGFIWPAGEQNFSRWLRLSTEVDVPALADLSLGILSEVFGHLPGQALEVTVVVPPD
jgi:hypothetical protein